MIIDDPEFGAVLVRRSALARGARFSISTSGRLQMSVPTYTSERAAKRYLSTCRDQIRKQLPVKDPATQRARDAKVKLLRKQAKAYLPYRLDFFAKKYGYHYDNLVFKHQTTRWGSCTRHTVKTGRSTTSTVTISLNIGLMNVPEPLRDYVLLHELAHINHPDHSAAFWAEVAAHDPRYKEHRQKLNSHFSPSV